MKYALSLRYGGMLVEAKDCNYESYLRLGLVCNNCGKPVYLHTASDRAEHKRKLKDGSLITVKESHIEAFFGHFREKNGASPEECEMRSRSLTPNEIQKRYAASRNQRLKKFQNQFWKLLSFNPRLSLLEEDIEFATTGFLSNCPLSDPENYRKLKLEKFVKGFFDTFVDNKHNAPDFIKTAVEDFASMDEEDLDVIARGSQLFKDHLISLQSGIESTMQAAIAIEVFEFLCHKSSQSIVEKLFLKSLADFVIFGEQGMVDENLKSNPKDYARKNPSLSKDSRIGVVQSYSYKNLALAKIKIDGEFQLRLTNYSKIFENIHKWNRQQTLTIYGWCFMNLLSFLALTPWTDAFDALENWSEEYKQKIEIANSDSRGVWHYTFNTNHNAYQSFSRIQFKTLEAVKPMRAVLAEMVVDSSVEIWLPEPFEEYKVKLTLGDGGALFDIIHGEDNIKGLIVTCGIAWRENSSNYLWDVMREAYLRSVDSKIKSNPNPTKPKKYPWLGVILFYNPYELTSDNNYTYPSWLADFEICFAQLLIGIN